VAKFYLTNKAVSDLESIWIYTAYTWSEKQADGYYFLLLDACQELAGDPEKGKPYDVVEKDLLGLKAGQYIVFFRRLAKDEVEVVRILHNRMDLKSHL